MWKRYLLSAMVLLFTTAGLHAQETGNSVPDEDTPRNGLLWDLSSRDGVQENYLRLDLSLGRQLSANAGISQSTDGTRGLYAGIVHNSKRGWLGMGYKNLSVSQDYTTQTFSLDSGRRVGAWDFSFMPAYITTSVYGQKGGSKSNAVNAAGVSLGATHRGEHMDIGLGLGTNFYATQLDSYVSDSRMISSDSLRTQLTTTGLEKSYWNVFMRRYQTWGNWGLEYLDAVSAVDLSHSQSLAARAVYYLGERWDLRLGLIQSAYPGMTYRTVTLGAQYYW